MNSEKKQRDFKAAELISCTTWKNQKNKIVLSFVETVNPLALFSTYCKCSFQTSKRRQEAKHPPLSAIYCMGQAAFIQITFPPSSFWKRWKICSLALSSFPTSRLWRQIQFSFHGGRKPRSDSIRHYENWQTRLHLSTNNFLCISHAPCSPFAFEY